MNAFIKKTHFKNKENKSSQKLYSWQKEALDTWYDKKFGIIEASTGSGKTQVAIEIIKSHKDCKFLIVVPKVSLANQWKKVIFKQLGLKTIPFSPSRFDDRNTIMIEVINTVSKEVDEITTWGPNVIIYDEVHRYTGKAFRKALELQVTKKPDVLKGKLGLTATVPDKGTKPIAYSTLMKNMKEIIYTYTISDARNDNLIAPYSLYITKVGLTDQEREEKTKIDNQIAYLKQKAIQLLKQKGIKLDIGRILEAQLPPEYQNEAIQELRTAFLRRRHLSYKSHFKMYNGCLTAQRILEKLPNEQLIIFTMTKNKADEVAKELERKDIITRTVHSGNDPYDNYCALQSFTLKDIPVLVTVKTLEEGIDIPHVRFIIIIAETKQIRQLIQRIGRTLRIDKNNPDKKAFIIMFEIEGDEFDIETIHESANESYYYDTNDIEQFYEDLISKVQ